MAVCAKSSHYLACFGSKDGVLHISVLDAIAAPCALCQ
jgi:hypothetical protein